MPTIFDQKKTKNKKNLKNYMQKLLKPNLLD